ncbi:hypothetical protein AB0K14_07720 [Actinosynnema sp. NPDC050801]|uniref:hypothetical protein n=1 Tax=unclassified Actinosynnema TaxID=2637065 RepID=UPI0033DFA91B
MRGWRRVGVAALVVLGGLAVPSAQAGGTEDDVVVTPLAAGDSVQRTASRSRDVTGDGWPDIVARQPGINNGALWVYTHSGRLQGMSTFSAKTLAGTNWNIYNWIGVAEVTGDESEVVAEAPADLVARRASDGALLVYPHSGTLNGTLTWGTPVVVGSGWNSQTKIILADVSGDGYDDILSFDGFGKWWVYPHSGNFDATRTFLPRVQVGQDSVGWIGWVMATSWYRENPDRIITVNGSGEVLAGRHSQKFNGTGTFAEEVLLSGAVFNWQTTTSLSLVDINGNGNDDIVKRLPDGKLMAYPYLGWGASPAFGAPVQVGQGWQIMDLIT